MEISPKFEFLINRQSKNCVELLSQILLCYRLNYKMSCSISELFTDHARTLRSGLEATELLFQNPVNSNPLNLTVEYYENEGLRKEFATVYSSNAIQNIQSNLLESIVEQKKEIADAFFELLIFTPVSEVKLIYNYLHQRRPGFVGAYNRKEYSDSEFRLRFFTELIAEIKQFLDGKTKQELLASNNLKLCLSSNAQFQPSTMNSLRLKNINLSGIIYHTDLIGLTNYWGCVTSNWYKLYCDNTSDDSNTDREIFLNKDSMSSAAAVLAYRIANRHRFDHAGVIKKLGPEFSNDLEGLNCSLRDEIINYVFAHEIGHIRFEKNIVDTLLEYDAKVKKRQYEISPIGEYVDWIFELYAEKYAIESSLENGSNMQFVKFWLIIRYLERFKSCNTPQDLRTLEDSLDYNIVIANSMLHDDPIDYIDQFIRRATEELMMCKCYRRMSAWFNTQKKLLFEQLIKELIQKSG